VVAGIKGVVTGTTTYDASISIGENALDYTLNNSLNGDAPLVNGEAVRVFDTGDFAQREINANVDFGSELSDNLFLAYGAEYREETFTQEAGDEAAFIGGGVSGTLNWKLASRYRFTDEFAVRGAISTGFHAPTPGQANLRSTTTTFDGMGNQIDVGLLPAASPEVADIGGAPLTEEEKRLISVSVSQPMFLAVLLR